jgi:hypothetical protein
VFLVFTHKNLGGLCALCGCFFFIPGGHSAA